MGTQMARKISNLRDSDWLNFIHFSRYRYKIRLVSILRKWEDQALISISTILKFSALGKYIWIYYIDWKISVLVNIVLETAVQVLDFRCFIRSDYLISSTDLGIIDFLVFLDPMISYSEKNWLEGGGDRVSVHFAVTFLDCWRTSFCVTTIIKIVNNNTNDTQTSGASLAC